MVKMQCVFLKTGERAPFEGVHFFRDYGWVERRVQEWNSSKTSDELIYNSLQGFYTSLGIKKRSVRDSYYQKGEVCTEDYMLVGPLIEEPNPDWGEYGL